MDKLRAFPSRPYPAEANAEPRWGYTGHKDTYSIAASGNLAPHSGSDDACVGKATTFDTIANHMRPYSSRALAPRTQIEAGGIARHSLEGNLDRIAERGIKVIHVSPLPTTSRFAGRRLVAYPTE